MKMTGQTILITGGSSGIGLALARQLLERGNTVIATGRNASRLAEAKEQLPQLHTYLCDQSSPDAIAELADKMRKDFPALNILINNAGIGLKRNLQDSSLELLDLEREIRSNLIGPIQLTHCLLAHLKVHSESMIVNVSSGLAFVPMPIKPIYCATKAAMHSYTQSLRVQLRHTSIKVVEVAPPATRTNFNHGQEEINIRMMMDPAKVAEATIRGMEKGREEILPGMSPVLRMLGRLAPGMVIRRSEAESMV